MKRIALIILAVALQAGVAVAEKQPSSFDAGVQLYNEKRYAEATEAFNRAIKRKDRAKEAKDYIEQIRKETVNEITMEAVRGTSKSLWESPFYYMRKIENRVRVGLSIQELFDRDSVNFRPGAVEALYAVVDTLSAGNPRMVVDIEIVSEVPQETIEVREITKHQIATAFAVMAKAAHTPRPATPPL